MWKLEKIPRKAMFVALIALVAVVGNEARSSEVDVCVNVLQDITGPKEEYRCGSFLSGDAICLVNPMCCTPGVCQVTPGCGLAKTVIGTIAKKGDVHCFKDVSAEQLFDRWKNKQIAFTTTILTFPVSDALLLVYRAEIDFIASRADPIPANIQTLLEQAIDPVYNHGVDGFSYADIHDVKIIRMSDNTDTEAFVQNGVNAITLGPVIIIRDEFFNALTDMNEDISLIQLLAEGDRTAFLQALEILIHELVHVQQYRHLGRDAFTLNYLFKNAPIVTDGYGRGPFEKEAYNFSADLVERFGGSLCAANQVRLDQLNELHDLGRPDTACRPYVAWMVPFLYNL